MSAIHGLGTAFPSELVGGERYGATPAQLERGGWKTIHAAAAAGETPALLLRAAQAAIADAGDARERVGAIVVARGGIAPELDATWLSLLLARRLGVANATCLDLKATGCAGLVQALHVVGPLAAARQWDRVLVVGGGASGYARRWLPTVDADDGVLVGDGAWAVVIGAAPGRFAIESAEVVTDPTFAEALTVDGTDHVIRTAAEEKAWLAAAPQHMARVAFEAIGRSTARLGVPIFFAGTNSGRALKREIAGRLTAGSTDPRFARGLDVQLAAMATDGHLFGGDTVANLCALRGADVLAPGDVIVCAEAGDVTFYGAMVLRVA